MKLYDAFCWLLIVLIASAALYYAMGFDEDRPSYDVACRDRNAYITYGYWSARVPKADKLCEQ